MHVKGTVPARSPKVINKDLPSDVEEETVLPKERKISSQEEDVPPEQFDGIVPVDVSYSKTKRSKGAQEREKIFNVSLQQKDSARWVQLWALIANNEVESACKNAESFVQKRR